MPGDTAFYKNNFPAPLNVKTAPLATLTFTQVGPNADSYEVYFTITTQLDSVAPSLTRMTTQLTAAAKPLAFSQDYSRCSSKVVLEKKLLDIVATLAK